VVIALSFRIKVALESQLNHIRTVTMATRQEAVARIAASRFELRPLRLAAMRWTYTTSGEITGQVTLVKPPRKGTAVVSKGHLCLRG
jgi:hypothetical protein